MERLSLEMYNEIIQEIHRLNCRTVVPALKSKFSNVSEKTLASILAQHYQRKMKKSHFKHHQAEVIQEYYARYLQGKLTKQPPGFLTKIADEVDLAPSLMAKVIVEGHLSGNSDKPVTSKQISTLMKDTTLIDCPVLSLEVHLCAINDGQYGPLTDVIKHSCGYEYEHKLKLQLREMGITFLGEDEMRVQGYDKTPDVKLEIPIAINGKVINWIESKALFGDRECHKTYLDEQFWSYWNRFGAGLVIYWFGFIEEIDVHSDKGILIRTDFPSEVTHMDPTIITY